MLSNYTEIEIPANTDLQEILSAELSELGFDSFVQQENSLLCYFPDANFDIKNLQEILQKYKIERSEISVKIPEQINWNAKWESEYEPIFLDKKLLIKASFHNIDETDFEYKLTIDPKMSFGTGHHATTRLVATAMFETNFENKTVLDMGTGTGVLAILAEKMGAKRLLGIDIENDAIENSIENAQKNNCEKITFKVGKIEAAENQKFDIILSNITRNVNASYLTYYSNMLNEKGSVILSGFFVTDIPMMDENAINEGFERLNKYEENEWCSLVYAKK